MLKKCSYICIYLTALVAGCLFFTSPSYSLEKRLTFEYNGQPMEEVANEISKQLNYKVLMDEDLAAATVSGQFEEVSLDDFLSRTFRGTNVIVQYDDKEKEVIIRSFGKKGKMIKYDQTQHASLDSEASESGSLGTEVEPGVTFRGVVASESEPGRMEISPGVMVGDIVVTETNPDQMEIAPGQVVGEVVGRGESNPEDTEISPGVKLSKAVIDDTGSSGGTEVEPGVIFQGVVGSPAAPPKE